MKISIIDESNIEVDGRVIPVTLPSTIEELVALIEQVLKYEDDQLLVIQDMI